MLLFLKSKKFTLINKIIRSRMMKFCLFWLMKLFMSCNFTFCFYIERNAIKTILITSALWTFVLVLINIRNFSQINLSLLCLTIFVDLHSFLINNYYSFTAFVAFYSLLIIPSILFYIYEFCFIQ